MQKEFVVKLRANFEQAVLVRKENNLRLAEAVRANEILRPEAERRRALFAVENKDFQQWINERLRNSDSKRIFDGYFSAILSMSETMSTTAKQKEEFDTVKNLLDTKGFSVFCSHYEEILKIVYNVEDHRTKDGEKQVQNMLNDKHNIILNQVLAIVNASLPYRPQ